MAFLSSWGHWEQQGSQQELLMPEVGLEGFGVIERSGARLPSVLLAVPPQAPQRPGAEALQVQAQPWETN